MLKKEPVRILVVEDDRGVSGMLEQILTAEGYAVLVANDGAEAATLVEQENFDLALLDINLPVRSGLDILKDIRVKDTDTGGFVPVIVLTALHTSKNDKALILDAGADDFIPKPFDLVDLLARVRSLLRIHDLYQRSQFLATHDPLTRCYNRRYFGDFLEREFDRSRRYKNKFSLLLLDLDKFKAINDLFGHEAGDLVLKQVGFRLQDFFRAVDCVARLGGDEFAAILPDCALPDAKRVAERLLLSINGAEMKAGLPTEVAAMMSLSVGLATAPKHGIDAATLLRHADQALYEAKRGGRNQFRIWQEKSLAA